MSTLHVVGGAPLAGTIDVEGNKNAALPLIAACLLTSEPCVLDNVPRIRDVDVLLRILERLGARVDGHGEPCVQVTCGEIDEFAGMQCLRAPGRLELHGALDALDGRLAGNLVLGKHLVALEDEAEDLDLPGLDQRG